MATVDNSLKIISRTDTELRVGNYMVLFGVRDDAGNFFTQSTNFDSYCTDTGKIEIDWEHGAGYEGLSKNDILGYVDMKTARIEKKGLFAERVLNRRNPYVKILEEIIGMGLLGTNTEPIESDIRKNPDGEITAWPLLRDSLTIYWQ